MKNAAKARNWTDDGAALLCKILVDPMNGFLHRFESKTLKKALSWQYFFLFLAFIKFRNGFPDLSFAIVNNFSVCNF